MMEVPWLQMRGLTERGVMATDEKPAERAVMVTDVAL